MTKPPRVVDAHSHYLPSALERALERREEYPRIVRRGTGRAIEYGPSHAYPFSGASADIGRKLEDMDRLGIDLSLLSVNVPGVDWFDGKEAGSIARDVNDELADLVRAHPGRLAALSILPLQVPDLAVAELERIVAAGFKGAMIYSNVAGRSLDDRDFRPFFDAAAALDAPIYIHPTYPLSVATVSAHALITIAGFLFDTTTAALRLIFDGLYERHPDFKLVLSHAASLIPYFVGRIDLESELYPGGRAALTAAPSEHIKRLYTDTVCAWAPAIALVVELLGPERVMFGTDHPFWPPEANLEALAEAALPAAARPAVESETAIRLFDLS